MSETGHSSEIGHAENLYRELIEAAPDAVLVLEEGRPNYLLANAAAEQLLGYSRAELLQMESLDILAAAERQRVSDALQEFEESGFWRGEWQLRRKDGTIVPVEATTSRHVIGGRVLYQGLFRDMSARKNAEEALARRESQLAEAQRLAHLGSWEWNIRADQGTMSEELGRIFGMDPAAPPITLDEFFGRLHPDDRSRVREIVGTALCTGESFEFEARAVRPNGEVRVFHSRGSVRHDASGHPERMLGTVLDITDRTRSEEALKASEAELRALFAAMSDIVLVLDRDGRHLRVAPTSPETEITSLAELPGKTIYDVFSLEDARTVHRYILEALDSGRTIEAKYSLSTGERIATFEARVSPITEDQVFWVARDVTLQKAADEQRARLSAIVESSNVAIVGCTLDGVITNWNNAAEELYGYSAQEAVGKSALIVFPPDRAHELGLSIQRLHDGERFQHFETVRRRKDGHPINVSITVSPIRDAGGAIVGASVIARDISYRMKVMAELEESNRNLEDALNELRQAQQRVIQQERLRAMGEMASGIAHDFNNALSMMLGYSELALERPETLRDPSTSRNFFEAINTAAKDAAHVVSRLREFYRPIGTFESLRPVDVNCLASQAIELTRPRWHDQALARGATIQVTSELGEIPLALGSEVELRDALTNLIFNAEAAIERDGEITIVTWAQGERVFLEVRDTGCGMSAEVRTRCLEPFFTTKGEQGTGLGLSSVHGAMQRLGGGLNIETTPGQGTTVRLAVRSAPTAVESRPANQISLAPQKILLVDDQPAVCRVVEMLLIADGHAVETAANGAEAIRKFDAGEFDIVVTDRAMPAMNGDELAVAIKQRSRTTPVLLLTGFGELMDRSGEFPIGVDEVLPKPPTPAKLRETLARLIQSTR